MDVLYVAPEGPVCVAGRDPSCDLVLDASYISRKHLIFTMITFDVALIEVLGTNGATVDGIKRNKGYKGYVRFGDRILAGSFELVWRGKDPERGSVFLGGVAKKELPDLSPVEIEGPPQRKIPEKPSVMLAAGPALTMAIPILLGASRSVAVLSSVFAAVWAAVNVLTRSRKLKAEETRRKNTYLSYILQCEETIRKRLADIASKLFRLYPETGEYLKGGGDPFILWNSDISADTGIKVRTGIGTCDSPLIINTPKERFAGVDDSLKQLPQTLRDRYKNIPSAPFLINLHPGSVSAILMGDTKDLEILSAVILNTASAYSPQNLQISIKTNKDIMRYYKWITILPHFTDEDRTASETGTEGMLFVTDDAADACRASSDGCMVILVLQGENNLPVGVCDVINRRRAQIRYDRIPEKLCYSYAAQLSRLWGSRGREEGIPENVPFGKLFGDAGSVPGPDSLKEMILTGYKSCDVRSHISAPIGIGEGGARTVLDLHEKASGPHGLIAGTTGSGKSELLTTLILSFATRYPPDRLAFFLIDYKGGGMSDQFSDLPHLAGAVSNLSAAESRRAMTALRAENLKRQKLFAKEGVNCINDYTALYEEGKVEEALPHVIIIVDEFAELKREEPDFLDCLISVSQTGRSLGMHLILATQKPSGVIDDRIRANSRFRIALRLVDGADSTDLIGRSDAIRIKECGRAYLRVGNDEIFECFQSGYAMGSAEGDDGKFKIYDDLLLENEIWPNVPEEKGSSQNKITWFDVYKTAVKGACSAGNFEHCRRMWLPPLPEKIEDDEAYAYYDDPYEQSYERAVWDPRSDGNLLVTGHSGSGKSALIEALLLRLKDMQGIYIIDCGGRKLKEFGALSCCGGYVDEEDTENMERLTGFLHERMTAARKGEFAGKGCALLVIDGLEEVRKNADQPVWDNIIAILSGGMAAGIYVLASALNEPDQRTGVLFNSVLMLGEHDPYSVSALLKVPSRDIPKIRDVPGRGIGLRGDRVLEFQAVKPQRREKPPPCEAAAPFPFVPMEPTLEDLLKRAVKEYPPSPGGQNRPEHLIPLPAGYEQKSGKIYRLPLERIRCILVCGPPYSGRHTFLFNISLIAARYGISCIRTDTYRSLIRTAKEHKEPVIAICESITDLIGGFYESGEGEETEMELAALFENPPPDHSGKNNTLVLVGITDNEVRLRFSGRRITDSILKRPYGISFGGRLDENRILDYSYLPFFQMQKTLKCHNATILKFDEKSYSGPAIFPGKNQCG